MPGNGGEKEKMPKERRVYRNKITNNFISVYEAFNKGIFHHDLCHINLNSHKNKHCQQFLSNCSNHMTNRWFFLIRIREGKISIKWNGNNSPINDFFRIWRHRTWLLINIILYNLYLFYFHRKLRLLLCRDANNNKEYK